MRILILSQYYYPEPVEKVHDLARGLVRKGHEVQVITGFPCYPQGEIYSGYRQSVAAEDELDGVRITRIPQLPDHSTSAIKRALYYLSFALSAATIGLVKARRADVMLVYQAALPIGLSAGLISKLRRIPLVPDVVDLWPESVVASGMLTNRIAIGALRYAARLVYALSDEIIVVTDGFRRSLRALGVPDEKMTVVHNWMPSETYLGGESGADEADRGAFSRRFNIMYAGNMGPSQDLATVIEAASLLRDLPDVQFVLAGGGLELDALTKLVQQRGLTNVLFLGRRPPASMPALYALADVLLVHLKPDSLSDVSIPSKTFSYMASGRPVLMAVRGDAEKFMAENRFGLSARPSDPESLAEAVRALHTMPGEERERMGQAALRSYRRKYCSEVQIDRVAELLARVAGQVTPALRIHDVHQSTGAVSNDVPMPLPTTQAVPRFITSTSSTADPHRPTECSQSLPPLDRAEVGRLLITGASGFLGAEIVRQAAAAGFKVRSLSRRPIDPPAGVEQHRADLLDEVSLAAGMTDIATVIHAAGLAHQFGNTTQAADQFDAVNRVGTENVVRAAIRAGVRHFVLVSSVSVYGDAGDACDELAECRPSSPYARSKWDAEQAATRVAQRSGMRLTILRMATIYGEGDPGNVARLMRAIDGRRFVWIGDGSNRKSLIHRDDAALACLYALRSAEQEVSIYNVSAPACTMRDVVCELARALGRSVVPLRVPASIARAAIKIPSRVGIMKRKLSSIGRTVEKWLADDVYLADKFERETGFRTQVDLNVGLTREVTWYRERNRRDAHEPQLELFVRDETTATLLPERAATRFRSLKRGIDVAGALTLLVIGFVPMLCIALAVKLTSKGPVLYWSDRVGRNNVLFRMPKFRTMRTDTPEVASHLIGDPNVWMTPIGNLLRRTSLDELPQLWNILIGEMSFVGPRPALFNQDDLITLRMRCGIHGLVPGLTGWAQVNGRDESTVPEKVELDRFYHEHQSLTLDVRIVAITCWKVLRREGTSVPTDVRGEKSSEIRQENRSTDKAA